jgi:hypothetical protein
MRSFFQQNALELPSPTEEFSANAATGDRTTKLIVAGSAVSLLFHLWLIGALHSLYFQEPITLEAGLIESRFRHDQPEEEPPELLELELADPSEDELPRQVTTLAASVGLAASDRPQSQTAPVPPISLDVLRPHRPMYDIPEGLRVDQRLVVPGTTGEGLIQLDAALDRITVEIASHLQERKVLLVWLLDQSLSVEGQRQAVARRLKRIYGELQALEQQSQFAKRDRPLLTGVVGFGHQTLFPLREPTDDFAEILSAFEALPVDTTGVEYVFTAVGQVMDRWHKYRVDHGRRILIVVLTDEAGDDHGTPLDLAIAKCRKWGAIAYVVGPAAPFGKRHGYVPYRAPEDGRTYQLPVDLGPESVVVENVDLPFWYDGPQFDNLSSGFGPYALSRLVRETGGVYFLTNMTTMAGLATVGTYDPHLMKAFEPDYRYGAPQEFLADLARHPLRAAVFAAAQHSQTTAHRAAGTPRLEFRITPNNFRQVFSDAQKSAAVTQYAVDSIFAKIPPQAEKAYASEPSLRWRMAFSLNYGRLLAQKVRAVEYNTALAELKTKYTEADVQNRVNHVILRPDRQVHYAVTLAKHARTAEEHLQRVIAEAPGTPWAILAGRELKDGFGIRVVERFVPPPPPPSQSANQPQAAPKRPKFAPEPTKPAARPAPPPKPVLPKL